MASALVLVAVRVNGEPGKSTAVGPGEGWRDSWLAMLVGMTANDGGVRE